MTLSFSGNVQLIELNPHCSSWENECTYMLNLKYFVSNRNHVTRVSQLRRKSNPQLSVKTKVQDTLLKL